MKIDLNSDLGEGFGRWKMGDDEALMKLVSSANIASLLQAAGKTWKDYPETSGTYYVRHDLRPVRLAQRDDVVM